MSRDPRRAEWSKNLAVAVVARMLASALDHLLWK
jgi:hypothetical protein